MGGKGWRGETNTISILYYKPTVSKNVQKQPH